MTSRGSSLLVLILAFVVLFSLLYVSGFYSREVQKPSVVTVTIPKGSSNAGSEHSNFEPDVIKVVIGVNNTVRWINQDNVPSSVVADDKSDEAFFKATKPDEGSGFLMPGGVFEYTFTKPGQFAYHSEPHPWKHGTVIVFPPTEELAKIPAKPIVSEDRAIEIAKADLTERVNNIEQISLYIKDSPDPEVRDTPLPLFYLDSGGNDGTIVYRIDSKESSISSVCNLQDMGRLCFTTSSEVQNSIKGRLVYFIDAAWSAKDGKSSPAYYYVDAMSGEVVFSYIGEDVYPELKGIVQEHTDNSSVDR